MVEKEVRKRRRRGSRIPIIFSSSDADEMAKRRCVMLLSVLSGATTITSAIEEAKISSALYYQLEHKALSAMLVALSPQGGAETASADQARTVAQLMERNKRLEIEKRRLERLLSMTRKVLKPGPLKQANLGRPKHSKRSQLSSAQAKKAMDTKIDQDHASTPTPDGAVAP